MVRTPMPLSPCVATQPYTVVWTVVDDAMAQGAVRPDATIGERGLRIERWYEDGEL